MTSVRVSETTLSVRVVEVVTPFSARGSSALFAFGMRGLELVSVLELESVLDVLCRLRSDALSGFRLRSWVRPVLSLGRSVRLSERSLRLSCLLGHVS